MTQLGKLWEVLEKEAGPIDLYDAIKKAGLPIKETETEWHCYEVEAWIRGPVGKWLEKLDKARKRNKKEKAKRLLSDFIASKEFMPLYLLKTKAKDEGLDNLFSAVPINGKIGFGFLNWTEMRASRRQYDTQRA